MSNNQGPMFSVAALKDEFRLSAAVAVSALGMLINLGGLFITQNALPPAVFNPLGLSWYFEGLYILWAAFMIASIGIKSMSDFSSLLITSSVLVLAALPLDLERALIDNLLSVGLATGGQIRFIGLLIIACSSFYALMLLSTEKTSFFHTLNFTGGIKFSIQPIRQNPKYLLVIGVATFGILVHLFGLFQSQLSVKTVKFNQFGLSWYFEWLYVAWVGSLILSIGTNSMENYLSVLNTLTTLVMVAIPIDMERSIRNSSLAIAGSGVRTAGYVFLLVPVLYTLLLLGSAKNSIVHTSTLPFFTTGSK